MISQLKSISLELSRRNGQGEILFQTKSLEMFDWFKDDPFDQRRLNLGPVSKNKKKKRWAQISLNDNMEGKETKDPWNDRDGSPGFEVAGAEASWTVYSNATWLVIPVLDQFNFNGKIEEKRNSQSISPADWPGSISMFPTDWNRRNWMRIPTRLEHSKWNSLGWWWNRNGGGSQNKAKERKKERRKGVAEWGDTGRRICGIVWSGSCSRQAAPFIGHMCSVQTHADITYGHAMRIATTTRSSNSSSSSSSLSSSPSSFSYFSE